MPNELFSQFDQKILSSILNVLTHKLFGPEKFVIGPALGVKCHHGRGREGAFFNGLDYVVGGVVGRESVTRDG